MYNIITQYLHTYAQVFSICLPTLKVMVGHLLSPALMEVALTSHRSGSWPLKPRCRCRGTCGETPEAPVALAELGAASQPWL